MVRRVRIDEVIASIAVSSGGVGNAREETVVRDLQKAIGASEDAAREAINRAVEFKYVAKRDDCVYVVRADD